MTTGPTRVTTATGALEGFLTGDVACFLGIPYAEPPVGPRRWQAPAPVRPWSGTRPAHSFGNPCVQHLDELPVMHERQRTPSEDCLYLNIWTLVGRSDPGRPVMVWIHGGAFVVGSGSAEEFDGTVLAGTGVVVVTLNYRLGPFGFLAHPELAAESPTGASGNYGLLDQLAALEWIRDNIAAFGGDPANVTIIGQSAGGISVSCHVASPRSRNLFTRAVSQSATWGTIPHGLPDTHTDLAQAADDAERFAARFGCTSGRIVEQLRARSAEDLLRATGHRVWFAPVVDGWFIPDDPIAVLAAGGGSSVPYLLGWTADEGSRFVAGGRGSDAAASFTEQAAVDPIRSVADAMGSPVFLYRFSRVPRTLLGEQFGAYHGVEVPYVFGNLPAHGGFDEADSELSRRIMRHWTSFARTGDPNPPADPGLPSLPMWPAYGPLVSQPLELA